MPGLLPGRLVERRSRKKRFGKRDVLPGVGLYLTVGSGRQDAIKGLCLLPAAWNRAPDAPTCPKRTRDVRQLDPAGRCSASPTVSICWPITPGFMYRRRQHPGNTTPISRLLAPGRAGFRWPPTTHRPNSRWRGPLRRPDLREINTLASIFTTVRIGLPTPVIRRRHRRRCPTIGGSRVATNAEGRPFETSTRRAPGHHASVAVWTLDRRCTAVSF